MEKAVVDASVVVKWFVSEENSAEALALRDAFVGNQVDLFAPSLMPFEVVNALCRASDEERFLLESSRSLAKYGIRLQGLNVPYFERVVTTARRNGVSIYDASYLALAEYIGCRLYTADGELLKRLTDADRKRAAHIVDFAP